MPEITRHENVPLRDMTNTELWQYLNSCSLQQAGTSSISYQIERALCELGRRIAKVSGTHVTWPDEWDWPRGESPKDTPAEEGGA